MHRKGDHEKAVDHLQKPQRTTPNSPRVYFRLGSVLYLIERYNAAIEAFANAIDAEPNYAMPRYHLGLSYLATAQTDRAYDAFQQYAELVSDDHRPHFQMAEIARQNDDYERAVGSYMRAIAISPVHIPSHLAWAISTPNTSTLTSPSGSCKPRCASNPITQTPKKSAPTFKNGCGEAVVSSHTPQHDLQIGQKVAITAPNELVALSDYPTP